MTSAFERGAFSGTTKLSCFLMEGKARDKPPKGSHMIEAMSIQGKVKTNKMLRALFMKQGIPFGLCLRRS
jgi:hypothetical protein